MCMAGERHVEASLQEMEMDNDTDINGSMPELLNVHMDPEGDDPTALEQEDLDKLVSETARMFQKSVREGDVRVAAKVLEAFQSSPQTLPKIVNWQDRVGATVFHWCAFYGTAKHVALARSFLKIPGADATLPDKSNHTACRTACVKGHAEMVGVFLEADPAISCDALELDAGDGMNCAHLAARRGDAAMLAVLRPHLELHGAVDARTGGDQPSTALYLAVDAEAPAAVRVLVASGASGRLGRALGDGEEESAEERARTASLQHVPDMLAP